MFKALLDARRLPFGRRRAARRLTVELTRRREFFSLCPFPFASYVTRSRRSRPTICWAYPASVNVEYVPCIPLAT
jgi:hypothetical protein